MLEGWWEKESTPSCLHKAVNPGNLTLPLGVGKTAFP